MSVQRNTLVIEIDTTNAARNARLISKELESIERNGTYASKSMDSASVAIRQLAGTMAGILTINKAIAMADGYTQMAARIRNATASAAEYDLVQSRILATANTTYRQLGEAQEVYLSMAGGMKSLGYQTTQTLDLVDSLSFSFTHNATRTDQAQSAMDALSKSMAKGKIDADAWISIVTGADNVIADMAKTTGQTEAEIRKLGAEGKASLSDLIETLIATREANKELADSMENSLADGFTKLSNAVTVYLGKANETTSATSILAGGLSTLADNLDLVANTGVAVGLGYVTTALLTKGAAVKQSLVDSAARRAADQAEIQSQVQLAAVEVQRTRQITALAAQEVHLARLELNSATTRDERAAATMRLTQAEIALNIATKNTTTATAAYSAAQAAATTTSLTLASTARSALAFMTGPVGLGITVATVAAGYLLLDSNSEKATVSLRENNEAVSDAIQKYRELDDVQKRGQQAVEKAKLSELAEGYKELTDDLNTNAYALSRHNDFTREQSREVNALIAEFKKTGDLDKFSAAINKLSFVSQDSKDKFNALAGQVRNSGNEYKNQKQFVDAMTNSLNQNAAAGDNAARGVRNAAEAVAEYTDKLKQQKWDLEFTNALVQKHGKSAQEADLLLQAYRENEKKGIKGVTAEQKELIKGIIAEEKVATQRNGALAKHTKAARESTLQQKKAVKDIREQQQIISSYSDDFKKFRINYLQEVERIKNAKFGDGEAELLKKAEQRYLFEEDMFLRQITEEINAHKWSEEEKLNHYYDSQRLIVEESGKYNDELKKLKIDSLDDQRAYELALIKLAQETRIFYMKQALMTESEAIRERYRLEREEIAKTRDPNLRSQQMTISILNEGHDTSVAQQGVAQRFAGAMGIDYSAEKALEDRRRAIIEYREWFDMSDAEFKSAMLANQSQFERDKQSLALGSLQTILAATSATWSQMTQLVKDGAGEQSGAYKAMFAMQQAFAMTSATVSAFLAYNQVLASPWNTDLISKSVAANIVLGMGMASVGAIAAQTMAGFSGGGFTGYGGKYEPAGIVHKGEGVLNQEEIRAIGGESGFNQLRQAIKSGYSTGGLVKDNQRVGSRVVNSIQQPISTSKAESISIQNHITIASDGNATTHSDSKQLGEMINQAVIAVIRREQRQGGLLAK